MLHRARRTGDAPDLVGTRTRAARLREFLPWRSYGKNRQIRAEARHRSAWRRKGNAAKGRAVEKIRIAGEKRWVALHWKSSAPLREPRRGTVPGSMAEAVQWGAQKRRGIGLDSGSLHGRGTGKRSNGEAKISNGTASGSVALKRHRKTEQCRGIAAQSTGRRKNSLETARKGSTKQRHCAAGPRCAEA